ncbi:MAG: PspC domain-containing protein [Pseudonocardiales bacterium]|nr:PspC domain-containing protein [Pseudonocardiales bacterium]
MSKTSVKHPGWDFWGQDSWGRDFWATRPRRRAGERKIAGVAAAIGRRYALDPALVRVAFVVTALFSGVGVLLYLLGWLLLPVETDQDGAAGSTARGRSSMSAALTIVLVLLVILTARKVFEGRASGVLALAVAVGTLMLLHRSRAALGEMPLREIPGSPSPAERPGTTAPGTPSPGTAPPAPNATAVRADRPDPPAWDPLGVAPFAWDLPEPATAPAHTPAPRGARSKVTPITLGLALLTGGIAVAFAPALAAAQIAALLLGVVGLGLVVGSFLRSGRGLVFLAVPLALLTWVLPATPPAGFKLDGSYWDPVTAAQVQPHYAVTVGNGHLDLTGLRLANGQTVTTSVAVGIGETHVILPPNVDVQVSCQTLIGQVHCLGRTSSSHPSRVVVTDNGADGPGGGKLILDVHSSVGQVHVERGS